MLDKGVELISGIGAVCTKYAGTTAGLFGGFSIPVITAPLADYFASALGVSKSPSRRIPGNPLSDFWIRGIFIALALSYRIAVLLAVLAIAGRYLFAVLLNILATFPKTLIFVFFVISPFFLNSPLSILFVPLSGCFTGASLAIRVKAIAMVFVLVKLGRGLRLIAADTGLKLAHLSPPFVTVRDVLLGQGVTENAFSRATLALQNYTTGGAL